MTDASSADTMSGRSSISMCPAPSARRTSKAGRQSRRLIERQDRIGVAPENPHRHLQASQLVAWDFALAVAARDGRGDLDQAFGLAGTGAHALQDVDSFAAAASKPGADMAGEAGPDVVARNGLGIAAQQRTVDFAAESAGRQQRQRRNPSGAERAISVAMAPPME